MAFRYYITNLFEGVIEGTNTKEIAENFSDSEDYFVLDSQLGKWIQPGKLYVDIRDVGDEAE